MIHNVFTFMEVEQRFVDDGQNYGYMSFAFQGFI